jgi:multisubunit Na+/H+ antiporter MnhB subunit
MLIAMIAASCLAAVALILTALAFRLVRSRRSPHTVFNGGIVLSVGLLTAAALPVLARLPWAELADEAFDQAVAAIHLIEVAYVILTL